MSPLTMILAYSAMSFAQYIFIALWVHRGHSRVVAALRRDIGVSDKLTVFWWKQARANQVRCTEGIQRQNEIRADLETAKRICARLNKQLSEIQNSHQLAEIEIARLQMKIQDYRDL